MFNDPVPFRVLREQGLRAQPPGLARAGTVPVGAAPVPVSNDPVPLGVLGEELPAGPPLGPRRVLAPLFEGLSSRRAPGRGTNPSGSSPWNRIGVLSPSKTHPRINSAPVRWFPAPWGRFSRK